MGVNGNDDDELMPDVPWPTSSVNTLNNDDFGLADLARLERQYAHEPAAFREMRIRAQKARQNIKAVNALEAAMPGSIANPKLPWKKMLAESMKTKANLEPRMALHKQTTREHLNQQAVNSIGREFSDQSIGSYVHSNMNSLEAQIAGASLASQGYNSLASQHSGIMGQIGHLRGQSMEAASSYIANRGVNPDAASTIQKNAEHMKDMAQQLVPITIAMQQLKQQGLDPIGRQRALIGVGDKAAGVLNYSRLEEEMRSGQGLGAFSPVELKKKETEAAEKLIKALEELRNSAGKTTQELESMNENAEQAAKEFEDIQDARGMPGGGDRYASEKIIAGTMAEALGLISSSYQNVAINQPMQMVQNVTSAANMENAKYNMWHAALSGDMTARMTLGAWETGAAFGDQQASRMGAVHAMRLTGSGIAAGLGALQIGEAGVGVAGDLVGQSAVENAAKGGKNLISGALGVIEEGAAWYRQTEKARLRIDSTNAVVGAAQAINAIPGQQLQKYRDYIMGINEAAGMMGGGVGESFLNTAAGSDFLSRMAGTGIGAKEMAALSSSGAAAMGSMFNVEQIFGAAGLERLGFGNAGANMQRMGTLGAAGIGDAGQNLAKLIEEGMQRGLNSSKAIDLIVENTARMTEESAMMGGGADPTEFLAKNILAAIDRTNPNKEMAGRIAFQTYQGNEGARHNIAASFPGIINVDRNMKDLGLGTDRMSAALLTQIPTHMLGAYRGKSETELKEFLEGRGVNVGGMDSSLFQGGKLLDILSANASISELAQQSGVGYATGSPGELLAEGMKFKGNNDVISALISGKNLSALSPEQRQLRAGVASGLAINGKNPAATLTNAFALAGIQLPPEVQKTLAELESDASGTARGAATFDKRLGGMAEAGQMSQGASLLGGGGKAGIQAIAESGRIAFEKAGKNAEEAWSKAASDTAANFGESAMNLNSATGKLDTVATNLMASTDAMKVVSESFSKIMKQQTESLVKEIDRILSKLPKGAQERGKY